MVPAFAACVCVEEVVVATPGSVDPIGTAVSDTGTVVAIVSSSKPDPVHDASLFSKLQL